MSLNTVGVSLYISDTPLKPLCRRAVAGRFGWSRVTSQHSCCGPGGRVLLCQRNVTSLLNLLLGDRASPDVEFVSNSAVCERMPDLEDLPVGSGASYISCFSYGILVFSQPHGTVGP